MKNANTILKTIMTKLGMEVKLEQMKLNDGVTIVEADEFAPEFEIFVVTEDEQKIALPIGEYELEDGRMIVVEQEGIISAINEKQEEEAEPEAEAQAEEEVEMQEPAQPQPKSIIESQVKEYKFSQEDMDAKDEKIAELEAKILELTKEPKVGATDIVEFSEEPKPISYNPENTSETKIDLGVETTMSRRDIILNNIYNK